MNQSMDLQSLWNQESQVAEPINPSRLQQGIKLSLKKQRRQMAKYYWSSFIYQLMIYAMAAHVFIRYWGNMKLMVMSIALVLLYIPFTWMQRKKYIALCGGNQRSGNLMSSSIKEHAGQQLLQLEQFFRFKKWYDVLVLPVNVALMVALVFETFVTGGVREHWIAALVVYLAFGSMFGLALLNENLKCFREPIRAYKKMLDEMSE